MKRHRPVSPGLAIVSGILSDMDASHIRALEKLNAGVASVPGRPFEDERRLVFTDLGAKAKGGYPDNHQKTDRHRPHGPHESLSHPAVLNAGAGHLGRTPL